MIFVGTERFMADILEEHFETLPTLWTLRDAAFGDGRTTLRSLVDLDERIAAHADGLVLAGDEALPLVADGLGSDDPKVVASATFVLTSMGSEAALRLVLDAIPKAEGPALAGIGQGLTPGLSSRSSRN